MGLRVKTAAGAVAAAIAVGGLGIGVSDARPASAKSSVACDADASRNRKGLLAVGLTDTGVFVCFDTGAVKRADTVGPVTGLVDDTSLVGIDYRPATGALVGVGNAGGIYTIDPETAVATFTARMNVALSGTSFGVDFNPTVDRIRVISDTGQNLRVVPDTGVTTTDTAVNYTAGTPAAGITAAAYTNNDADPDTATTLFDIDTTLDQVVIQAPPNAGTLNPAGKLGVDAAPVAGFDIYTSTKKGVTAGNDGFAALSVDGSSRLYRVSLLTGKLEALGRFPTNVVDIAIPLDQ